MYTELAGKRGSCVHFVIFQGWYYPDYPDWFLYDVFDGESDLQYVEHLNAIEGETVIVRRQDGDVKLTTLDAFNSVYDILCDDIACLKQDCIEFFHFYHQLDPYPDWVQRCIDAGIIGINTNGTRMFYDSNGEIALDPACIFVRNRKGQVMYVSEETFREVYWCDMFDYEVYDWNMSFGDMNFDQ